MARTKRQRIATEGELHMMAHMLALQQHMADRWDIPVIGHTAEQFLELTLPFVRPPSAPKRSTAQRQTAKTGSTSTNVDAQGRSSLPPNPSSLNPMTPIPTALNPISPNPITPNPTALNPNLQNPIAPSPITPGLITSNPNPRNSVHPNSITPISTPLSAFPLTSLQKPFEANSFPKTINSTTPPPSLKSSFYLSPNESRSTGSPVPPLSRNLPSSSFPSPYSP